MEAAGFLAAGTLSFWVLIVIEVILLFFFLEVVERGLLATISVLVFLATLQWVGGNDIWGYVKNHPFEVIGSIVAWHVIGTAETIYRWRVYLRDTYDEAKERWLDRNGPNSLVGLTEKQAKDWNKFIISQTPQLSQHKAVVLGRITYWPLDFAWYLASDFFYRISQHIYRSIAGYLQEQARRMFSSELITIEPTEPSDSKT